MSGMEIDDHIAALQEQGLMLANAASYAGLDAVVPTCPGWRMRDLVRHIGYVHRWAAGYVTSQVTEMVPDLTEAEQLSAGPADGELAEWYRAGHADLVTALRNADLAMSAWTFLPAPSPLAFWARRQAHETAIHCADAEVAAGRQPSYLAGFAADGVDELLIAFFGRDAAGADAASADAGGAAAADRGRLLLIRAADTGQAWHVRLSQDASRVLATGRGDRQDSAAADCTVTGPASGLYLLLWNRADPVAADVAVSGDAELLRSWPASRRVTWE